MSENFKTNLITPIIYIYADLWVPSFGKSIVKNMTENVQSIFSHLTFKVTVNLQISYIQNTYIILEQDLQ